MGIGSLHECALGGLPSRPSPRCGAPSRTSRGGGEPGARYVRGVDAESPRCTVVLASGAVSHRDMNGPALGPRRELVRMPTSPRNDVLSRCSVA